METSFSKIVLSWSPYQIRNSPTRPDKSTDDVLKGGVVRHDFVDAAQYYSFLIEGVLEEAWGVVRQGLLASNSTPYVATELLSVQAAANANSPSAVSLRPVGGQWGEKGYLATFLNSVVELEYDGYGLSKTSMLGFCGHQTDLKQGILQVKVVVPHSQLREMSASCTKAPAGGWRRLKSSVVMEFLIGPVQIRPLNVSLISQQRMCESLMAGTEVPFMHSLLTGKGGAALDDSNPFLSMSSDGVGMLPRTKSAAFSALNASQAGAMGAFYSASPRELHCVVGPPGTGKTTALSALIIALVDDGKRCLVTAPSNKAVQVLAERFKADVEKQGKGGINISMLAADDKVENSKYLRECYTNTWGEANCEKVQTFIDKISPLADKSMPLTADVHPVLQSAQAEILNLQKDIRKHAPTHDNKNNITKHLKAAAEALATVAGMIQPAAAIRKKPAASSTAKKPAKKENKKDKKLQKKRGGKGDDTASVASDSTAASTQENGPEVPELEDNDASVANGDHAANGASVIDDSAYESMAAAIENLSTVQKSIREGYDELELLNHAQVIFGTLAVLGRTHVRMGMRAVDVLVVDEAGQSTEAETCIAFLYKPQKCLLVGDTRQLPSTVFSKEAEKLGYGRSLMTRLVDQCKYAHAMLNTQYRMHPEIRKWPSRRFYQDRLRDDKCVLGQSRAAPWHAEPFLGPYAFVDVDDGVESKKGNSYANDLEVHMCVTMLRHMHARYGIDVGKRAAIITFYAGQVEALKAALAETFWGDGVAMTVPVHTVDSFQGCETDIVLLSMVRANQREAVGFLKDYRRLNVALTRGRYSVIVVGNGNTISCVPNSDLESLVKEARARGAWHPGQQVHKAMKNWRKGKTSKGVAEDAAVPDEPADAAANGDEEVDDWESLA